MPGYPVALLQVRMEFHLVHSRFNAIGGDEAIQLCRSEVGNADMADFI